MIFSSKYKRRIEIALLKAKMKLKDIEAEKLIYKDYKKAFELCGCIVRGDELKSKIKLLDALLKGKDIQF